MFSVSFLVPHRHRYMNQGMGDVPHGQQTQQSRPHVQWPGMGFMHVPTNYVLCFNLRSICVIYGLLGSMLQVRDHTTFILCYCLHSRYGTRWITWTCARGKQLLGGPYKWFLYTMGALMLCIGTCDTFPCAQRITSLWHSCSKVFAYFFWLLSCTFVEPPFASIATTGVSNTDCVLLF